LQELGSGGFSAYGIAEDDGGVAIIEVPKGSAADRAGLKSGDLLLKINESKVSKVGQVRRLAEQFDTQPLTLKIMRDQTPKNLTLQP
jgi:S1-C subfamily serine protease